MAAETLLSLPTLDRNEALCDRVNTQEEPFKRNGPNAWRCFLIAKNDIGWTLITVHFDKHVAQLLLMTPTVRKSEAHHTLGTYSEAAECFSRNGGKGGPGIDERVDGDTISDGADECDGVKKCAHEPDYPTFERPARASLLPRARFH